MLTKQEREQRIENSSRLVAKAVVSAILITLVSFSPILFLEGQEKKLFSPLVWTKTFAMIGSMFVAVVVVPVLMVLLLKGKVRAESKHPVSRFFIFLYSPIHRFRLSPQFYGKRNGKKSIWPKQQSEQPQKLTPWVFNTCCQL